MAEIEVYGIGSTSFSVKLIDLQTTGITYTRKCAWTVYEVPSYNSVASSVTYITPGYPEGGDFNFTGMSPDTQYDVNCYITRTDTGAYLTSLSCDPFYTESNDSGGGDSGGEAPTWSMDYYAQTDVDDYGASLYGEFSNYSVVECPVTFPGNGEIWIDFGGDTNTVVYISTATDIDYTTGEPLSYEAVSYNGNISHFWVSDAETYYIYVRSDTGTESGSFWIDISPPWVMAASASTIYVPESGYTETIGVSKLTLHRHAFVFLESGTVKISLSEDSFVDCWIGTSTDYGAGAPLEHDVFIDHFDSTPVEYNVTKGIKYYVWFTSAYSGYYTESTLNISYDEDVVTINKWSWSDSNGSANATETYNAYLSLVNDNIPTTNFSHLVWNDMVDKVHEIVWAKTKWWDEDAEHTSYYDTKMHSEPYELTAVMFNSLRNNIELIGNRSDVLGYKTGIGAVYAKDSDFPVRAEYFTALANYINNCIDNL